LHSSENKFGGRARCDCDASKIGNRFNKPGYAPGEPSATLARTIRELVPTGFIRRHCVVPILLYVPAPRGGHPLRANAESCSLRLDRQRIGVAMDQLPFFAFGRKISMTRRLVATVSFFGFMRTLPV
jgi:hypothetical protein